MSTTVSFIEFEKIKDIGGDEGKNSDCFLAKDIQLDENLVIKKVSKAKLDLKKSDYFSESKMINDSIHPNVVKIQYASQDEGYIYFAMPHYKNGSLHTIAKQRYLTTKEVLNYAFDILSGVLFIHSKKLLHLDIKPSNILVDNNNKAVITDFGLSKYTNEHGLAIQDNAYRLHSDPDYFKGPRGIHSDIHQIGLTLYRLCNGIDILKEEFNMICLSVERKNSKLDRDEVLDKSIIKLNEKIKNGSYPSRDGYLPHVPANLKKVINKALQVDETKRYTSVLEMMDDLSSIELDMDWKYNPSDAEIYTCIKGNQKYSIEFDEHRKCVELYKENIYTNRKTNQKKHTKFIKDVKNNVLKTISVIMKEID